MTSQDTASYAVQYIERGWAVVPLHDVVGGTCSCGSADPRHHGKQGGKHPLYEGWQNAGIRDASAVRDFWARRPGANLGIVTGRASGIWALDVDPDNAGDRQLAGLVAAFGPLPETRIHRTGSGGAHYFWTMPDFEFTNSRGRLPLGLDVRGNASQVVAPPSFTLKGPYSVVLDVPVVEAPGWLLGMIRPAERVEVELGGGAGGADVRWEGDGGGTLDRGRAYANVAVRDLLGQLGAAQVGERNMVAYRVGRRLAELVNSPWSGLNVDHVWAAYMEAAARADVDGGFSQTEAHDVLAKAVRDQGGRGVGLPVADFYGTAVDWVPPTDFDQARQVPGAGVQIEGSWTAGSTVPIESTNGPPEQATADPVFDQNVRAELGRIMVRREALRRDRALLDALSPIQIMNREAQLAIPRSQPLINGWLNCGQAARIYGPPGAGKSFAAIEMAACIAQGIPWHGKAVTQGEVIYFAVEDAEGVALRLRAWEVYHQTEHRVHIVSNPVQMNVDTVHRVLAAIRAYFGDRHIALIVLDTQAMVTVGMDENSVADMGIFVEAIKLLVAQTGATVLTVHHSGLRGGRARGSTSVLGAMDVEIEAAMSGTSMTLAAVKQKNIAKPPPLMATLNVIGMGEQDVFGTAITSCVLLAAEDATGPFTSPIGPGLTPLQRRAMAIATVLLETDATGEAYSRVRVRAAEMTDFGKSPNTITSTFSRAWAYLVERGRVAKAASREAYYFIEVEGLDRLAANPGKRVSGGPEVYTGMDE